VYVCLQLLLFTVVPAVLALVYRSETERSLALLQKAAECTDGSHLASQRSVFRKRRSEHDKVRQNMTIDKLSSDELVAQIKTEAATEDLPIEEPNRDTEQKPEIVEEQGAGLELGPEPESEMEQDRDPKQKPKTEQEPRPGLELGPEPESEPNVNLIPPTNP
jgi:hypothetical protein